MACRKLTYYNETELEKVSLKKELTLKKSLKTTYNFYLFGFNQGSEKDDEIFGVTGSLYTTRFRELDTRVVRWWSIDPKTKLTPWESPYVSMSNNPISVVDPFGDIGVFRGRKYTQVLTIREMLNINLDEKERIYHKCQKVFRKNLIKV